MKSRLWLAGLLSVVFAFLPSDFGPIAQAQQSSKVEPEEAYKCGMRLEVSGPLIDEAEQKQFNTKRVEIVGNTYTRGREFWRRMASGMNEGDIFTRVGLEQSIKKISRMKTVFPITAENIEIRLDREGETIDIVFCVKQNPKK